MSKMKERLIDWKDAATHRVPTWPLAGYAPGGYLGRCIRCDGRFIDMDKRAIHCLPCAIDSAKETLENYRVEVHRLTIENSTLRAAIAIVSPSPTEE
jgi:hypothetical protein